MEKFFSIIEENRRLIMRKRHRNQPVSEAPSEVMDVLQSLQEELQVEINGYGEVVDYLLEYPDMLNLLPEMGKAIREKFPDAKLVLEVYKDPEIDCEDLEFYIRYTSYEEELTHRIVEGIWEICEKFSDKVKDKEGFIAIIADFKSA